METWVSILLKALLAIIPACMADKRGRSAGGYYLFGLFCPLLVPIIVLASIGPVDSLREHTTETSATAAEKSNVVEETPCLEVKEVSDPSFAEETSVAGASTEYYVDMSQAVPTAEIPEQTADGMVGCPYCGQLIPATDKFCTFCGAKRGE